MSRPSFEIREAAERDIAGLIPLYTRFIAEMGENTGDPYFVIRKDVPLERAYKRHLRETLRDAAGRFLVAADGEGIAGFIAGKIQPCYFPLSEVGRVGYISIAYVEKEYRRKGLMRRLESEMCEWFRSKGIVYVDLNYLAANAPAVKTWTQFGYETFRVQARKKLID